MELDEYGKGRLAVIKEMITFCESEINKVKLESTGQQPELKLLNGNKIKAYAKVIQKLKFKQNNLNPIKQ